MVLIPLGVALFIAPQDIPWPWTLTALTGRTTGAWLIGVGVLAGLQVFENGRRRVGVVLVAYVSFVVLQLLAIVPFGDGLEWGEAGLWLFLVFLLSMLLVALLGRTALRRPAAGTRAIAD